jgi:hypothetical protein
MNYLDGLIRTRSPTLHQSSGAVCRRPPMRVMYQAGVAAWEEPAGMTGGCAVAEVPTKNTPQRLMSYGTLSSGASTSVSGLCCPSH